MTTPDPKARLAELERLCAASGTPLTVQRRSVLEELVSRDDHPTVDQIHAAVSQRLPDVSRATVYRVLETLGELGLIRRIEHAGSAVRFDGNTEPHHHFACSLCGRIEDLPLSAVQGFSDLVYVATQAHYVSELTVLVRGTCAACVASSCTPSSF